METGRRPRACLATDLAQFVGALQRIDTAGGPPPSEHNAFRGVPLATRDESTRASIAALAAHYRRRGGNGGLGGFASCARVGRARRSGSTAISTLAMFSSGEGRLAAVIDWGCLGVGDPACDVAVAWKLLSAHTRGVFWTALSVDDATWAREPGLGALPGGQRAVVLHAGDEPRARPRGAGRWLAEAVGASALRAN